MWKGSRYIIWHFRRVQPSGSPVVPKSGTHTKSGPPTIFIRSRSVSKFDHYSLVGSTFLLPPEENGERFNFHLPHGISEYSFAIEDAFSNFKSRKQYGSSYSLPDLEQHESSYNLLTQWDPGEKPLQPPLFRKAIATKINYFVWFQSEYNLSCMLSKHWELLKILQVLQKLLITNDLIPLIPRSATQERTRKSD